MLAAKAAFKLARDDFKAAKQEFKDAKKDANENYEQEKEALEMRECFNESERLAIIARGDCLNNLL